MAQRSCVTGTLSFTHQIFTKFGKYRLSCLVRFDCHTSLDSQTITHLDHIRGESCVRSSSLISLVAWSGMARNEWRILATHINRLHDQYWRKNTNNHKSSSHQKRPKRFIATLLFISSYLKTTVGTPKNHTNLKHFYKRIVRRINHLDQNNTGWTLCISNHIVYLNSSTCIKLLGKLNPFIDGSEILRVCGRIGHTNIPFNASHPIILPKSCFLTQLLIASAHKINLLIAPHHCISPTELLDNFCLESPVHNLFSS